MSPASISPAPSRNSSSPEFKPGDPVILTGWRVGELHWGGYAERARVKADWLVHRPAGLSAKQAMAIGTAGFTAMLAVIALERHGLKQDLGEVLVTGAAGGVGGVAVSLLAALGYRVVASTGRPELRDYLEGLGAAELLDRAALAAKPTRPLDRERWAGAIDAVGGNTLATILTPAQISRQRRLLRARRRQRPAGERHPVPAARRQPARHRFGHVPAGRARSRPGIASRATCRSTGSTG